MSRGSRGSRGSLNRDVYSNILMVDPDNKPITMISEDRSNHYIKKGLAFLIDNKTLKLSFFPKGYAKNPKFDLSYKESRCVVCGTKDNLSKHHVIPYRYRKLFPLYLKSFFHHDVLPLCDEHHDFYEKFVYDFENDVIFKKYNGDKLLKEFEMNNFFKSCMYAIKFSKTIIRQKESLPPKVKLKMLRYIKKVFALNDLPNDHFLNEILNLKTQHTYTFPRIYKEVVDYIIKNNLLDEFVIQWRKHFLETMKPKFLLDGWNVNFSSRDQLRTFVLPII